MRSFSSRSLVACVLACISVVLPATVQAQEPPAVGTECQAAGAIAGVVIAATADNNRLSPPDDGAIVHLVTRLDEDANGAAQGAALLWSGADHEPIVLIPLSITAACADTNGDGIAGLVQIALSFVVVESGEEVSGLIVTPDGGEMGDDGDATLLLDAENRNRAIMVTLRTWDQ
jgi:hypothetical protein